MRVAAAPVGVPGLLKDFPGEGLPGLRVESCEYNHRTFALHRLTGVCSSWDGAGCGSVLLAPPDGSVLLTQLLDTLCIREAHGSVLLTSLSGACVWFCSRSVSLWGPEGGLTGGGSSGLGLAVEAII